PGATTVDRVAAAVPPRDPREADALREALTADVGDLATHTLSDTAWEPLLMEWEAELFPLARGGGGVDVGLMDYDPHAISRFFELKPDSWVLTLKEGEGRTVRGANMYRGQAILTSTVVDTMADRLDGHLRHELVKEYNAEAEESDRIKPPDPEATGRLSDDELDRLLAWYRGRTAGAAGSATDSTRTALLARAHLRTTNVVAQSLGGFNEALVMRQQTFQLPVSEPLGFPRDRAFTSDVRQAVGQENRTAPLPLADFNPVRAGGLDISGVRLLDSFGRPSGLVDTGDVLTTEQLSDGLGRHRVFLPPRLSQPARVDLRLLAADLDGVEANSHPATSPVCGWLVPNHLDGSLAVHDASGVALGAVLPESVRGRARWEPAPVTGVLEPEKIPERHLFLTAEGLVRGGPAALRTLLGQVEDISGRVAPASDPSLALLVGRPLALIRARLRIELTEPVAVNQGYDALARDLTRTSRETNGFTAVEIPLRLGEDKLREDGLIGFWLADSTATEDFLTTGSVLTRAIDDPPLEVMMLVEPHGCVHVTTGVLPVEQVRIAPDHFREALERLEVTVQVAPLLTGTTSTELPLPDEPGFAWQLIERDGPDWAVTAPPALAAAPGAAGGDFPSRLREGWLRLSPSRVHPHEGDRP
ncbi:MAG: hypothetical protein WBB15_09500, partial [Ornithinimicrobium sp.]